MYILLLLLSLAAVADSDSQFTFDKSFPRDNTFCHFKDQRIEILIRGSNKFTEPREVGYGEFLFFRNLPTRKPTLLTLNKSRGDTFKLFLGTSPFCSKSHGYLLDSRKLAILLLKENRPFIDKLVIQFFDIPSMRPAEYLETSYQADRAMKTENGFAVRVNSENYNRDMGTVKIEGEKFIYQEEQFPQWINYTTKSGFEILSSMTYEKFPWKDAFRDESDFLAMSGWDPETKNFQRKIIYVAVNHKLKKKCLLLIEAKQKPAGGEAWRCQAM